MTGLPESNHKGRSGEYVRVRQSLSGLLGKELSDEDIRRLQRRYQAEHGFKPSLYDLVTFARMDANPKVQKAAASLREFHKYGIEERR